MGFEVKITDEAFADLDVIAEFIKRKASVDIARTWLAAILNTIESLREMPGRCPLAPESEEIEDEIRFLLHGRKNRTYKIYFKIHHTTASGGSVQVFHVRHWARRPIDADELEDLMEDDSEFGNENE